MDVVLWLGYEQDCDGHWETGQMTLDMEQWKDLGTIFGALG